MRDRWHRFLDALLGEHCRHGCGQRVFPRDIADHEHVSHAGDPTPREDHR